MDDNDLDVAVSMMDELNMREEASSGSGSSGDTATDQRPPYVFDDPLGKAGTLGLELNKLQQLNTGGCAEINVKKHQIDIVVLQTLQRLDRRVCFGDYRDIVTLRAQLTQSVYRRCFVIDGECA